MARRLAPVLALFLAFAALSAHAAAAPAAAKPFADWAAVVVAGDHEDSDGNSTEGFDNARRAVARNLVRLGFAPDHIAQFSARPRAYKYEKLHTTRPNSVMRTLLALTQKAPGGCLLYFSSHGEEDGLVVGNWIVPPRALAQVVDHACEARPTVVILSACFSGVMLPALKRPNRMVLTAARRDRTSFGCGQADRYPYFDQCVLETWDRADSFPDLAARTRACVAAREKKEHLSPASEPQLWIGPDALASLPRWR